MSKFKLEEEVIFLPSKKTTKIIKILPKGTYNLSHDFYIAECDPGKTYTDVAFRKVNKALHMPRKNNECINSDGTKCRWLVDISKDAFCFLTNQRVYSSIKNDLRPSQCLKGTEEEQKILEESNNARQKKKEHSRSNRT